MTNSKTQTYATTRLDDLNNELSNLGLKVGDDGYVHWKKGSLHHPRNWSGWRKAYDTSLIVFLDFFTTAVSTAGAPAADQARHEYKLEETLSVFCFVSIYLLGQALGGIIFPACSETFGRKKLYLSATLIYALFCITIAAIPSIVAVLVGRFTTGVVSAIPTIVVAGSIEDLFDTEARVWMIFTWGAASFLGLVLGSIVGTYVSVILGWRFVFYGAAVVTTGLFILLLWIKESRPSQILEQQVIAARQMLAWDSLQIRNPDYISSIKSFIHTALFRPLKLTQ